MAFTLQDIIDKIPVFYFEKNVEIIKDNDMTIYVLDRWNKGRTPQIVHEDMVEKYTLIDNK